MGKGTPSFINTMELLVPNNFLMIQLSLSLHRFLQINSLLSLPLSYHCLVFTARMTRCEWLGFFSIEIYHLQSLYQLNYLISHFFPHKYYNINITKLHPMIILISYVPRKFLFINEMIFFQ